MRISVAPQRILCVLTLLFCLIVIAPLHAQVYAGRPKLIVIVVIDQFRGDYLNRDRTKFEGRGFNLCLPPSGAACWRTVTRSTATGTS